MVTSSDDDDSSNVLKGTAASVPGQHKVFELRRSEGGGPAWVERLHTHVRQVCRRMGCLRTSSQASGEEAAIGKDKQHFRLDPNQGHNTWLYFLSCGWLGGRQRRTIGISPNQQLAMYLHWMFRVNFLFLFCVMCIMFFVWVMVFAALIIIAGTMDPHCVRIGGAPFGEVGSEFADAFALSWTTFSTVGYGSAYPAVGSESDSPTNCFFITFICSLESLLGVLYSGFCGAILFGKVLRIQSHAQVIFSDPIVIRYGKGVAEEADDGNSSDDQGPAGPKTHPCPVLEFRIVNRLFNEAGGEIMDATLNVVANVDAHYVDPSNVDAQDASRKRHNRGLAGGSEESHDSSCSNHHAENIPVNHHAKNNMAGATPSFAKFLDPFHSLFPGKSELSGGMEEDPTIRNVNKRIFSKMLIEASDHPFFKRVWLARHVLDDTSPLLKPRIRKQIRRNGGRWPARLCHWNAIRDSMQFNQILVSLNGVSNVSASDVYAQKIYDFVDVNVGYQFVNILYKDTDGALKVDTDLINDVREQKGGGGEPLILDE